MFIAGVWAGLGKQVTCCFAERVSVMVRFNPDLSPAGITSKLALCASGAGSGPHLPIPIWGWSHQTPRDPTHLETRLSTDLIWPGQKCAPVYL